MKTFLLKNRKINLGLALVTLCGSLAFGHGTGVGSGGDSPDSTRLTVTELNLRTNDRQTLDQILIEISDWTGKSSNTLGQSLRRAINLANKGDFLGANALLERDIQNVARSYVIKSGQPLTKKLVDRVLKYIQAIAPYRVNPSSVKMSWEIDELSYFAFLSSYVKLIQNQSRDFDSQYYVPYVFRFDRCRHSCEDRFDMRQFTRRYLNAVKDELNLILTQFVSQPKSNGPNNRGVYPEVSTTLLLVVLELASEQAAIEIGSTLSRHQLAPIIDALSEVSTSISNFNQGDNSELNNKRQAINFAIQNLNAVVREIDRLSSNSTSSKRVQLVRSSVYAQGQRFQLPSQESLVIRVYGDAQSLRVNGALLIYAIVDDQRKLIAEIPLPAVDPHFSFAGNFYADAIEVYSKQDGGTIQILNLNVDIDDAYLGRIQ